VTSLLVLTFHLLATLPIRAFGAKFTTKAHEWGVVAELVPNGKALSRARELAALYLRGPEVTRRNTRVHFIHPLKERIVREVGYGLSLEGASAADLVKSMQAQSEAVAEKRKSA
jgi:hypothetical protein